MPHGPAGVYQEAQDEESPCPRLTAPITLTCPRRATRTGRSGRAPRQGRGRGRGKRPAQRTGRTRRAGTCALWRLGEEGPRHRLLNRRALPLPGICLGESEDPRIRPTPRAHAGWAKRAGGWVGGASFDRSAGARYFSPSTSNMSYSPGPLPCPHSTAFSAPRANNVRSLAICFSTIRSPAAAKITSCSPTMSPPRIA